MLWIYILYWQNQRNHPPLLNTTTNYIPIISFHLFVNSLHKLHKIQSSFLPEPIVFYQSNLEFCLSGDQLHHDNLIGTHKFKSNQFELNSIWQIVEEQNLANSKYVPIKNINYFIEKAGIDLKSSVQLIFDVYSQLIEVRLYSFKYLITMIKFIMKRCGTCFITI